ncbi:unnamed protein product [Auanema sp. JU1783]|nr:unnamed protein product [Auanema sp. JU1783]
MLATRFLSTSNALRNIFIKANPTNIIRTRKALVITTFGSATYALLNTKRFHCQNDNPWLLVPSVPTISHPKSVVELLAVAPIQTFHFIIRAIRIALRCFSFFVLYTPLLVSYPFAVYVPGFDKLWWSFLLFVLQTSGPTFLKLGQWASTRRDIFSKEFCDRLSVLHTKSKKKRYFKERKDVFDSLFGKGFYAKHSKDVIKHVEPYSVGSGCIAQVYKASIDLEELAKCTGKSFPELKDKKIIDIAIKVADENTGSLIELDLSILKFLAKTCQILMPSLEYIDPVGALQQFETVLRKQVDLRNEARALIKFASNFDHSKTGIRFPVVIAYNSNLLAETFENGMYINRLVSEENDSELQSKQSPAVRRRIAQLGARALLKMIFVDNFVHGDLHPGNILIRFNDNEEHLPGVHRAPPSDSIFKQGSDFIRNLLDWRAKPKVKFTDSPYVQDEPTLVLLDTGIAISETEEKLQNLKTLFRAIVEKKGYEAGHMLLTRSHKQNCTDPDKFCKQVEALVDRAMSERSLRTLNISAVLSEMFSIVAEHKVALDASFTTVILSVMVLEGFGRSLDPDLDLFQCARPYLLNVIF